MKEQIEKISKILKSGGFPDKEINIYLSTLELGRGTVAEISRKAGINRSTGYVILDSLANKNLVSISGKEPKQEYVAESPTNLIKYLSEKIEQQKNLTQNVEKLLPELITLYKKGDRARIRFYEGIEGLEKVYEDTLLASGDIVATSTYENMHATLPKYFSTYYARRAKKKIHVRTFVTDTPLARERRLNDEEENRETIFVPKDKYPLPIEIDVYDNKVMIASWREKIGIIIESQDIATTMKSVFELAFIEARRLDNRLS